MIKEIKNSFRKKCPVCLITGISFIKDISADDLESLDLFFLEKANKCLQFRRICAMMIPIGFTECCDSDCSTNITGYKYEELNHGKAVHQDTWCQ